MVWQTQDTLRLIEYYREAPELWNPDDANYKNRAVRRANILRIAEKLNVNQLEIERKLKGLRTQYSREHVKTLAGQKSIWFGYDPLTFLTKGKRYILADDDETINDSSDFDHIDEIELLNENGESNEIILSNEDFKFVDTEAIRNSRMHKRSTEMDRNYFKKFKLNSSSSLDQNMTDEYTMFAECVSHKLRQINSLRVRAIAQYYINSVLFQAEMTNYEEDFEFTAPQEFTLFHINKKDKDSTS